MFSKTKMFRERCKCHAQPLYLRFEPVFEEEHLQKKFFFEKTKAVLLISDTLLVFISLPFV